MFNAGFKAGDCVAIIAAADLDALLADRARLAAELEAVTKERDYLREWVAWKKRTEGVTAMAYPLSDFAKGNPEPKPEAPASKPRHVHTALDGSRTWAGCTGSSCELCGDPAWPKECSGTGKAPAGEGP